MPPGLYSFAVTCCMQSTSYTSWCQASLSIMQAVQCFPCSMRSCTIPALATVSQHAACPVPSACLPKCSVQVVSCTPCTREASSLLITKAADLNADGHSHIDLPENISMNCMGCIGPGVMCRDKHCLVDACWSAHYLCLPMPSKACIAKGQAHKLGCIPTCSPA